MPLQLINDNLKTPGQKPSSLQFINVHVRI